MSFTLGSATTIQGVANSRRITGYGNLTDLQTCLSGISAPFTTSFNGNVLSMSGGGTAILIVIAGSLVEQRGGEYSVVVSNKASICWGDSTGSNTTTAAAGYSTSATSITVGSSSNIIVNSFLTFNGITTGGDNNSPYYRVVSVAGTTIGLATGLASSITNGSTITVAGSSVLGSTAGGLKISQVDVSYAADALGTWSYGSDPVATNNPELCLVGIGVLRHLCGSITCSHTARYDLDFYKTSHIWLDWVNLNQMEGTGAYQHFFYGNFYSTNNTSISKNNTNGGGVLESGGSTPILNIPSFACNNNLGMGFTGTFSTSSVMTVIKPQYYVLGYLSPGTSISCKIYDPAYLYLTPSPPNWSDPGVVYELFRTFNISWVTPDGISVGTSAIPAKLVVLGGSTGPSTLSTQNIVSVPSSQSFSSTTTTQTLRQSYKSSGSSYTFDGVASATGYSDDSVYNLYLVSYGNSYQALNYSAKPTSATVTINGITINCVSTKNTLATTVPYASVVTSPFTMNASTNTLSISSNCTTDQIGQYLLKHCYDNPTNSYYTNLNHTIATVYGTELSAVPNMVLGSNVIVSAGNLTNSLVTTGLVSLSANAAISVPYTDSSGSHVAITVTGLVSGSRVQLYNVTDSTELYNNIVSGSILIQGVTISGSKNIRIRVVNVYGATAYNEYTTNGTLSTNGLSFVVNQTLNTIYNTNGIAGSTCTEFIADYAHVYVDIVSGSSSTIQRMYAWWCYNLMTSLGIATYFGGITAQDSINYVINTTITNVTLFNTNTTPAIMTGARLARDDNSTIIATTSNSLQIDSGKAYMSNSSAIQTSLTTIQNSTSLIPALL
jgi:hypothetical protein